jgi:hypothetical protein
MAGSSYTLRLDPWAPEYEGMVQLGDDLEPASVDIRVERPVWEAVRPAPGPVAARIAFVDGVRRIERRLVVIEGERSYFGLLGSYGVGAVYVDSSARVGHEMVGRVLVTGGGYKTRPFEAAVDGRLRLRFEPVTEADPDPGAPVDGLQTAMRQSEASLAERLAAEVDVVFQDGPLTYLTAAARGAVVGFVKRLLRPYLDPSAQALLPRLAVGERTPVFLIAGRDPRYSWYLRIAHGRVIESELTGIARLEAPAARGLDEARQLADLSARLLPRFASDAARDPRAPQNLYPIGGLEAQLKHRLGDPAVVRRAIEAQLHSEVTAELTAGVIA